MDLKETKEEENTGAHDESPKKDRKEKQIMAHDGYSQRACQLFI